jgi:hypothetical protein
LISRCAGIYGSQESQTKSQNRPSGSVQQAAALDDLVGMKAEAMRILASGF